MRHVRTETVACRLTCSPHYWLLRPTHTSRAAVTSLSTVEKFLRRRPAPAAAAPGEHARLVLDGTTPTTSYLTHPAGHEAPRVNRQE